MSKRMRDSNIELLRILAVMGVVLLHFNGIYGNAFGHVATNSATDYMLRYLECLCAPAVNLFILISGYYMCNSYQRNVVKPLCLLIQVMLFSEACYLLTVLYRGISTFSVWSAINALLPCNYYVILYITLYFVSPYINLALGHLNARQEKIFLCVNIFFFSLFPIAVDILQEISGKTFQGLNPIGLLGDQDGYTIVQFCLLYVIGAYLKKRKGQWSMRRSTVILIFCSVLLLLWSKILPQTAWAYCNPLVILEAIAIFQLFQRIHIRSIWMNRASKAVFTCFLLHGIFIKLLPVEQMVQLNVWILLLLLIAMLIGVYIVCWCVHWVYDYFERYAIKNMLKICDRVVLSVEPMNEGETCK